MCLSIMFADWCALITANVMFFKYIFAWVHIRPSKRYSWPIMAFLFTNDRNCDPQNIQPLLHIYTFHKIISSIAFNRTQADQFFIKMMSSRMCLKEFSCISNFKQACKTIVKMTRPTCFNVTFMTYINVRNILQFKNPTIWLIVSKRGTPYNCWSLS